MGAPRARGVALSRKNLARARAFDIRSRVARGRRSRAAFFSRPVRLPFDHGWRAAERTIMANPFNFLQDVRAKARKVTWPTRRETLITTGVVILMVFMTALFFLSVDEIIRLLRRLHPAASAADGRDRPDFPFQDQTMTKRWYIVHAYSNFEKKVSESIREQAKQRGLEDQFDEILVPVETVVEVRRGRKVNAERKFFPGYVLVKMDLTDEVYHLIKNTPK